MIKPEALSVLGILLLSGYTGADAMFAPENGSNRILRINLPAFSTTEVSTALADAPNASAWDDSSQRFFYSNLTGGHLYVWDVALDSHAYLGKVGDHGGPASPTIASASFHGGAYYFVENSSANLWRVTFDFSGTPAIDSVVLVADMTPDSTAWGFGDIAIDAAGVLYGCGIRIGDNLNELFRYNLVGFGGFLSIRTDSVTSFPSVQLGFDAAGVSLHGSDASDGKYYSIDKVTGALAQLGTLSSPVADMSSILSDTAAPAISCPDAIRIRILSGSTATVHFDVDATDDRDPSPTIVCTPVSGSLFPLGTTMVTCFATDLAGNQSACTFPVTVWRPVRPR